jgi:hypothetical protein
MSGGAPLRLVRVIWEDASIADDGGPWIDRDGIKSPEPVMFDQVGWLFELTASHVVISACVGERLIAPRDRIPTGMVRSITEFTVDGGVAVPIPKKRKRTQ